MVPNISEALATGDRVIGFLTWYDSRNVSITPADLKTLFSQHGLNEKHLPDNIKPKHAFQKACRKAMVDDSSSSDTRRSIARLIVDGMDKIVYGIVDLNVFEKQESIDPDFSDKVWLDKDTWTVHYDKGHDMSKRVVDEYNRLCGHYTTRDISRMIVRAVDNMAAVPLRDAGVIYFVPAVFDKDLHALQNVVNNMGNCNMRVFALGADGGNATNIEKVAKSQFADKIKSMKEDIADLKQSIDSNVIKGKTIENSIEVRMRRYRELRERCSIMADSLKFKAEGLLGEIDEVGNMIKNDLMDVD